MVTDASPTYNTLAGRYLDREERFCVDIPNQNIVKDEPGVERSSGSIVDKKWPSAGNLGRERTPLTLRVNVDRLSDPFFVSQLLADMLKQARQGRGTVEIDA